MRVLFVSMAALASWPTGAEAQSADQYPLEETDRPVVMFDGMTRLDISIDLPTYVRTMTDSTGHVTTTTTSIGDDHPLDLSLAHSFGPAEVTGRIVDRLASASVAVQLGSLPAIAGVALDYFQHGGGLRYEDSQAVFFAYKALLAPSHLAIEAVAGASIIEAGYNTASGTLSGNVVQVYGRPELEIQLAKRVALAVFPGVVVPVHAPAAFDEKTYWFAYSELEYTFPRWDLYAVAQAVDLTGTPRPYLSFGFVHRFGP